MGRGLGRHGTPRSCLPFAPLRKLITAAPPLTPPLPPPRISAPQDGKLTQGARLGAGLGAGVSEALLIVTPFEVVKTRMQQQKGTDRALLKYRVRCVPRQLAPGSGG